MISDLELLHKLDELRRAARSDEDFDEGIFQARVGVHRVGPEAGERLDQGVEFFRLDRLRDRSEGQRQQAKRGAKCHHRQADDAMNAAGWRGGMKPEAT